MGNIKINQKAPEGVTERDIGRPTQSLVQKVDDHQVAADLCRRSAARLRIASSIPWLTPWATDLTPLRGWIVLRRRISLSFVRSLIRRLEQLNQIIAELRFAG